MHERREEMEELNFELSQAKKENEKVREEARRTVDELSRSAKEATKRMEDAVIQQVESDAVLKTVREAEAMLRKENETLRSRLHELQRTDADREVKVVKLEKEKEEIQNSLLGLNMALEGKQQELELVCDVLFIFDSNDNLG